MGEKEDTAKFIADATISVYGDMIANMAIAVSKACSRNGIEEMSDKVLEEVLRQSIGVEVSWRAK